MQKEFESKRSQKKPTLAERIQHALVMIEIAASETQKQISIQADNPKIQKRFEGCPSAFVVESSQLAIAGKWDVFSHDWKNQYDYASELIRKRQFSALEHLLSGHSYRDKSSGLKSFAPEVIEKISAITGDMRLAIQRIGGIQITEGPSIPDPSIHVRKSPRAFR